MRDELKCVCEGEEMKIKIEVEDAEFPEIPQFPKHLVLMWAGIRQERIERLLWIAVMCPPIFPFLGMIKSGR